MPNNAVTLRYPYRPYCLANLIIAKRNSSSLLGLAWYRKLNRDMPSSKQVRRSDVFSFWRVWTIAWRNPSIVRPSSLNNQGFPAKSIYQAVTLLQSSLDAHFPFQVHASQKTVSVQFHQTSYANNNMSYIKFLLRDTNSLHQAHHANGHQSHVISSAHLRENIVSSPSLNPPDPIIKRCIFCLLYTSDAADE